MKKGMLPLLAIVLIAFTWACSDSKERYMDLSTGKTIEVEKDEKTGFMVIKGSDEPLYIYVDTKKNDTIYAKTGKVINGHVILSANKQYIYDEDQEFKSEVTGGAEYKDGDYKVEVEKDGDTKTKNGDTKVKVDGETGERKVKKD